MVLYLQRSISYSPDYAIRRTNQIFTMFYDIYSVSNSLIIWRKHQQEDCL